MDLNFFKDNKVEKSTNSNFLDKITSLFKKELKDYLEQSNYTLDRFEGDIAVCQNRETGEILNVSKEKLPKEAAEGQILKGKRDSFEIETIETEKVKERIKNKFDNLVKKE